MVLSRLEVERSLLARIRTLKLSYYGQTKDFPWVLDIWRCRLCKEEL